MFLLAAVHSNSSSQPCCRENEARFLPCSDSVHAQLEGYKKLEVGDDFDVEEEK